MGGVEEGFEEGGYGDGGVASFKDITLIVDEVGLSRLVAKD